MRFSDSVLVKLPSLLTKKRVMALPLLLATSKAERFVSKAMLSTSPLDVPIKE